MPQAPIVTAPAVDYGLMLARMEELALCGADPEALRRLLAQRELLEVLDAAGLRTVATCAQIAQDRATAEAALEALHRRHPQDPWSWQEHGELLAALGDRPALVRLRALCQRLAPQHLGLLPAAAAPAPDTAAVPDAPFARQAREQALLAAYQGLFRGRADVYARQWANKAEGTSGYVPVRQPLTEADLRDHLLGRRTLGIYLLTAEGRTYLGVIDADLAKEWRGRDLPAAQRQTLRRELAYLLARTPELAQELGLRCLTEFSGGKGYHFWFPFAEAVEPARVRATLGRIAASLQRDLQAFRLEVFPKQDGLSGKGLGNLVKLPLGIHRVTGKPSRLLPSVRGDLWSQLEPLTRFTPNPAAALAALPQQAAPILDHPAQAAWKERFPELAELSAACPLLAGLVALCREGKALSLREERVLLGTVGFLPRRRELLHALMGDMEGYNPHLLDYKISRLRGSPLGCRKIHALLESARDFCPAPEGPGYQHPLRYLAGWSAEAVERSERVAGLQDALAELRRALDLVARFLPAGG